MLRHRYLPCVVPRMAQAAANTKDYAHDDTTQSSNNATTISGSSSNLRPVQEPYDTSQHQTILRWLPWTESRSCPLLVINDRFSIHPKHVLLLPVLRDIRHRFAPPWFLIRGGHNTCFFFPVAHPLPNHPRHQFPAHHSQRVHDHKKHLRWTPCYPVQHPLANDTKPALTLEPYKNLYQVHGNMQSILTILFFHFREMIRRPRMMINNPMTAAKIHPNSTD